MAKKKQYGEISDELPVVEAESVESSDKLVKKNFTLNMGSMNGGKDRIVHLIAGDKLPAEVEDKFISSLEVEGVI